jgi:hypothetical protein
MHAASPLQKAYARYETLQLEIPTIPLPIRPQNLQPPKAQSPRFHPFTLGKSRPPPRHPESRPRRKASRSSRFASNTRRSVYATASPARYEASHPPVGLQRPRILSARPGPARPGPARCPPARPANVRARIDAQCRGRECRDRGRKHAQPTDGRFAGPGQFGQFETGRARRASLVERA